MHQVDDRRRHLLVGAVGAEDGLQGLGEEAAGVLGIDAAVEDGEHAEEGDELVCCGDGRLGFELCCFVLAILVTVAPQQLESLEHLEDHLPRVAQARHGLETRVGAGQADEVEHQIPSYFLRELGVLEDLVEGRQHFRAQVRLDDGQVREAVGRGGAGFADGLDGLGRVGFGGLCGHYCVWSLVMGCTVFLFADGCCTVVKQEGMVGWRDGG